MGGLRRCAVSEAHAVELELKNFESKENILNIKNKREFEFKKKKFEIKKERRFEFRVFQNAKNALKAPNGVLSGGPCGIRTCDQLIKSQLLYQLS